ncbi:TetR family transcriptional regulator [Variovorax ginsengisoli]|uniref:TetR family transcriptional regulator n=1 Tax=Variovorax ginsengisoli TaxID=363844 RepID=A0ABT8RZX4_9BURK|nr:TetR family transcriptional regulator [Variovorax ginsengisoli]MDN8613057.1 TetR family transcriptional regulator [Variovorax ginsengisoli]MDO1532227.1 TetR family transcriptional regulator [Variovorax ginsengisoli]
MVRRTKEEAQETRNRLLDAAEILFQAQGVSQTSLQQIAHQAGATRGAIYWHFKDKAALFNAMMDRVTLPLEAEVARASAGSGAEPMGEVEHQMVEALKLMTSDMQVRRVFDIATHKVEYTHDMESVQQRHLSARNGCVTEFEKAMVADARRTRRRLPIPAPAAAQGLHALISGLIQNWLLDPSAFDLVATGRQAFRVYLAGLGFTPDVPGAVR